jgi:hypothetical protein
MGTLFRATQAVLAMLPFVGEALKPCFVSSSDGAVLAPQNALF